jgi:glycosyltransferase involved in cell wall biosynthesis
MPNGIPLPDNPTRRVQGTDLNVGFLGRLDADKDPGLAVAALAQARALGARARLEMRGAGPLEAQVRAAVERFRLQSYVALDGFIADPAELYGRVDVLLLSSRSEGMPLVVLEAMGHELPVVATRVGAVPLQVQHGVTGLLAEAGDAVELGEALAWLDAHPLERQKMGKRGRRRLRTLFSVEQMTLKVSQTYDRVTEAERRSARSAS